MKERYDMALIRDMVKVTISELGLNKIEPTTADEWRVVNAYLSDKVGK